jgi:hypothetical protein
MEALGRLLRRSRTFLARTRLEFSRTVKAAFRPAPVPTIDVWRRPAQEIPGRGATARPTAQRAVAGRICPAEWRYFFHEAVGFRGRSAAKLRAACRWMKTA